MISSAKDNPKNIYILVEPSVIYGDKYKIINKIFKNMDDLRIRNVFLDIMGSDQVVKHTHFNKKHTLKGLTLYKNEKYNLTKELGTLTSKLKKRGLKGEDTLLIILGDFQLWRKNGTSTIGYYLSDSWLSSKYSPFVRNFINNNNSELSNMKVLVLGQQNTSTHNHYMHELFMAKLFSLANNSIKLSGYFITKNQININNVEFSFNLINYSLNNSTFVKSTKLNNSNLFQLNRDNGASIDIAADEVRKL